MRCTSVGADTKKLTGIIESLLKEQEFRGGEEGQIARIRDTGVRWVDAGCRYRGCLLGLACGDAVGTIVEFSERGSFPPVTDMVGGGPFHLPAGAWTDDTSMAL